MDGNTGGFPLLVSDLRQYVYCPRIPYFNYVVPIPRYKTVKMQEGQEIHEEVMGKEARRTLAKYGLDSGTREFRLPLESQKLGISGVLDMLISSYDLHPVEFKNAWSFGLHHKYQVVAYAMLVEEMRAKPVRDGFVYLIPARRVVRVWVDSQARDFVRKIISAVKNMIAEGRMPARTRSGGRCRDCEFRNYCREG